MDKQKHEMGDTTSQKKKKKKEVGKIDLLHQPLWQTHMAHNLLKQKLSQGMIIGKRKLSKAFPKECLCMHLLDFPV